MEPTSILIVRTGAMGDILHALPAVAALRSALPGCRIGWAVETHWAPLLAGPEGSGPLVDRIHLAPTRAWKRRPFALETMRQIAALRRELRGERYGLAVDLQGTVRSALIGRLSGSELTGPDAPREGAAAMLYDRRVRVTGPNVIEQAGEILSAATGRTVATAAVQLPPDAEAESWAASVVPEIGRVALLHPTTGWGSKQWPVEHFAALAGGLSRLGWRVLTNAGATLTTATAPDAEPIACSIAELIALTRRVSLVIGGDSGPVHLAAALGVPTVALFGPTDPARNGPSFPGASTRVLRNGLSRPSYKRTGTPDPGLAAITPDEVLTAIAELTGGAHG